MNSVHDMGGMHGLGAIQREQNEPVFHADWEARVYALTRVLRLGPKWNIHMSRYSMEQMEPARYLSSSYYERWLAGLEKRLLDSGVLSPEELADGKPRPGGKPVPKMTAEEVRASLGPWRAPHVEGDGPARFKPRACSSGSSGTSSESATTATRRERASAVNGGGRSARFEARSRTPRIAKQRRRASASAGLDHPPPGSSSASRRRRSSFGS